MYSFFTAVPLLAGFIFLFSPPSLEKNNSRLFKIIGIVSICALVYFLEAPLSARHIFLGRAESTIDFYKNRESFADRQQTAWKDDVLPTEWNDVIGEKTVQILPWELCYAAANHWAGWQPNPVFQLYTVYTKKLDEYSAASFTPARAPQFALLEYNAIDGRNMFLDTPATWNAITPNYHILLQDEQRLLLTKNEALRTLKFTPFKAEKYQFNEPIIIPHRETPVYARIEITPSIIGKIVTTLFRGRPLTAIVTYQDDAPKEYRVIADTLNSPTLISNIPGNYAQMVDFWRGKNTGSAVEKIEFSNRTIGDWFYRNEIKIEWLESVQ
ncbi:hypothetical protein FACS1894139_17930 [Planctomycetales bacterium]|nr:hypothetical protein FACS1894107_15270 [Planctomycetales bacterium]GHT08345.1 hypothetical protein FACS1894139_17930 [Planctomycetales bacterium]